MLRLGIRFPQTLFLFFSFFKIYLFMAVVSLLLHTGFPLVVASGGYSLVAVCGLLMAAASLIGEHGL